MPARSCRSRANQLAAEPESAVRMQPSGRRGESSQKTRCGLIGSASLMRARLQQLPPLGDARLDLLAPAAVRLALEQRQQRAQRLRASPTRLTSIG